MKSTIFVQNRQNLFDHLSQISYLKFRLGVISIPTPLRLRLAKLLLIAMPTNNASTINASPQNLAIAAKTATARTASSASTAFASRSNFQPAAKTATAFTGILAIGSASTVLA